MPSDLRGAIVKPLIKKPSLDRDNLKNYRPVSNLAYLGKLIESVVIEEIDAHIYNNHLHEPLQSAYTPNHSTETAVIRVYNDILCALDHRQCVYLVLLDLSAAFDTIDHQVFLSRLQKDYGVKGDVTDWMASYLSDRHQTIDINGTFSEKLLLKYGFPQGSKIGPFGFKLYTKPLTSIAKKHNIQIHLYADDTQLYTSFDPENSSQAIKRIEDCIVDIRLWMAQNCLKLNDSKTEFIIFGSEWDLERVENRSVRVGESIVLPSKSVRNIGAMLDSTLTMETHINSIIKSCYFQIRSISKIRKYLTIDATKSLTHAFVTSRLDNMNALLYKIPDCQIKKLERIQKHAARIIMMQKKSSEITPFLIKLHWLPIPFRFEYKILLQVYKCLHGKGPEYLSELLEEYRPPLNLRSTNRYRPLQVPATKKGYGDRAFSVAGPTLWKALPDSIRKSPSVDSFKKALKTFYFKKAYNS